MPTSTEKVFDMLERLEDFDDEILAQTLPVPPSVARMAIAAAGARVPTDPAVLDDWAIRVAVFCLELRSDDAPPYSILQPEAGERPVVTEEMP
jgi:hypothetical protein